MNRWLRFLAFNIVGLGGAAVQLASLALLMAWGLHYLAATAAAVLLSVVHNFLWHRLWTWRDRRGCAPSTFIRFALANGAVSLAGNLGVMATLVAGAGMPPIAANLVSMAVCGLLNFWIGDAFVFTRGT
jgi:putative flippase GtrA